MQSTLPEPWMQTFTGRKFCPLNPRPQDVCLDDIAHALAHQCRFGGHVSRFYSVAEHAVHISRALENRYPNELILAACGLHHDDAKAYVPATVRAIKLAVPSLSRIEARILDTIAAHFQLPPAFAYRPDIEMLDTAILLDERTELMGAPPEPWGVAIEAGGGAGVIVLGLTPTQAKTEFIARHNDLLSRITGRAAQ